MSNGKSFAKASQRTRYSTISLANFNNTSMVSHSLGKFVDRPIKVGQLQVNVNFMGICWNERTLVAFNCFSSSRNSHGEINNEYNGASENEMYRPISS